MLSSKQREYRREATHRWNVKTGATRSGKTYGDYWLIPRRIIDIDGLPGAAVLIGNTLGTLQRNIIDPMRELYGDDIVSPIRRGDNTIQLCGRTVYCLGADNVKHVNRLRGMSIAYCYGDEVTTWHPEVFDMLKSRLDKPYSVFDGTCNPEGPQHWFKKFLESNADIYQQAYTIDDNPFLSPVFVENLKREYEGTVYYGRYILGQWIKAEGLIYPFFGDSCYTDEIVAPNTYGWEYYISCDYGTMNPCAMLLWALNMRERRAVVLREFYYTGRGQSAQRTDAEYYDDLLDLAGKYRIEAVVIDPSAASFIAEIRKHGRFDVQKASNDVVEGIRCTATLIKSGKVKIHRSCVNTINEFGQYAWDEKSNIDRPIKENDHAMDSIRYQCYTIIRRLGW